MAIAIIMLAALATQAHGPRAVPGVSESPIARAPVSSIEGSPPPDLPRDAGPRGTSGEQRYDATGYAGVAQSGGDPQAITATSDAVAQGGFVEITALDSGKTIVALVSGRDTGGGIIGLSPGATRLLGIEGGSTGLRVRNVTPTPQDQVALRNGHPASPRIDAPQALLVALRKRLPVAAPARTAWRAPSVGAAPRVGASYTPPASVAQRDVPIPSPAPSRSPVLSHQSVQHALPPVASGWYVQVAALSSRERAQALVGSLGGGRLVSSGGVHRVQIGPYGNAATAARARDDAARRGYAGARVVHD